MFANSSKIMKHNEMFLCLHFFKLISIHISNVFFMSHEKCALGFVHSAISHILYGFVVIHCSAFLFDPWFAEKFTNYKATADTKCS